MNVLFFGPNGSGKGTQGAILKDKYNIPHIESGAIFRENISKGTELGAKAKEYIDRGDLVPDEITIPMILDRLKKDDCKNGWLLDGFPRNKNQAIKLDEALKEAGMALDIVIEILLDREIAKNRIMGRRLCVNDNNHPNNIYIDAIKPDSFQNTFFIAYDHVQIATPPMANTNRHDFSQNSNLLVRHQLIQRHDMTSINILSWEKSN